ncbi:YdcF family protein [uncultured Jatrophihabitans sp.]|uniref:YdcF family protein n=1 Tax=uncultured Jatrophihabitans sp. TaxID=1610747 RepID=UPI0035CA888F
MPRRSFRGPLLAKAVVRLLLILIIGWSVATYFLVVRPSLQSPPRHVDAVVVLGPASVAGALNLGIQDVRRGAATTLVISTAEAGFDNHLCNVLLRPGARTVCFFPHPATTAGEAQFVSVLARRSKWSSVTVITGRYHAARAAFLLRRCFAGRVYAVGADRGLRWSTWIRQIFYESGAWPKALARHDCS